MALDTATGFFSYIPTDWIIIAVLAVLIAFDAVRSGTDRACALVLSLPATLFIVAELSKAGFLSGFASQLTSPALKSALFGVVFIITYLLVRRITDTYGNGGGAIIQALLAGIATVSVVVVVWLQLPELQSVWRFGPQVQAVFAEQFRFWWIVGSYATLAYVRD